MDRTADRADHSRVTHPIVRVAVVILVTMLCVQVVGSTERAGVAPAHASSNGGVFIPTDGHHRIADTRNGLGDVGTTPLGPGETRTLAVAGRGGLPALSQVGAVMLDISVVGPTSSTVIVAWPSTQTQPATSNLNAAAGDSVSNSAIIAMDTSGAIKIRNSGGSTDILIDVQGYFTPTATGTTGYFTSVTGRVVDTRTGVGLAQAAQLPAGGSVTVSLQNVGTPATTESVFANLTVINPSVTGSITVFPSDTARPANATVNYSPHTFAGSFISELSTPAKAITIFNGGSLAVDVAVDLQGAFAGVGAGQGGFTSTAGRVFDSRTTSSIPARGTVDVTVTGHAGVPTLGALSVALNLTTVSAVDATGYLSAWPTDTGGEATTFVGTSLTQFDTVTRATLAVLSLSDDGQITFMNNSSGTVQLVVDAQGWFTPVLAGDGGEADCMQAASVVAPTAGPRYWTCTGGALTYSDSGAQNAIWATYNFAPSDDPDVDPVTSFSDPAGQYDLDPQTFDANGGLVAPSQNGYEAPLGIKTGAQYISNDAACENVKFCWLKSTRYSAKLKINGWYGKSDESGVTKWGSWDLIWSQWGGSPYWRYNANFIWDNGDPIDDLSLWAEIKQVKAAAKDPTKALVFMGPYGNPVINYDGTASLWIPSVKGYRSSSTTYANKLKTTTIKYYDELAGTYHAHGLWWRTGTWHTGYFQGERVNSSDTFTNIYYTSHRP